MRDRQIIAQTITLKSHPRTLRQSHAITSTSHLCRRRRVPLRHETGVRRRADDRSARIVNLAAVLVRVPLVHGTEQDAQAGEAAAQEPDAGRRLGRRADVLVGPPLPS